MTPLRFAQPLFYPAPGAFSLFLLLLLLLAAAVPAARAHGGGTPQLENAAAGPYVVSVWTTPDPPRVGAYHVTVSVAHPDDAGNAGEPVLGADVTLRLTPQTADAQPLTTQASTETADNKLFYEGDVALPAPGAWAVQVMVDGPNGRGETGFEIDVVDGQSVNWALVGAVGAAVLTAVFVVLRILCRRAQANVDGDE